MLADGWVVTLVLRQNTKNEIGHRLQCGSLFLKIIDFCLLRRLKCLRFRDFCRGHAVNYKVLILLLWREISVVCNERPALMLDGKRVRLVVLHSGVRGGGVNGYFLFLRWPYNLLWFSLCQGLVHFLLTWQVWMYWLGLLFRSLVLVHRVIVRIAYVVDFCELSDCLKYVID